jgi:hypothetical protein
MKKTLLSVVISSLALGSIGAQAEGFDSLVKDGSVNANFRLRSESVDQVEAKDGALALTLKSRITVKTGAAYGLSALVEGDNVSHLNDEFNDDPALKGTAKNDFVLDQETTQLNQAYLQYANESTTVKAGNQRINLDNQRHVGGVAFRQDEATFDAVSVKNTDIANTTIFAAFANNLNSITDDDVEADITLLNVKYQVNPDLAATGFYYDVEDSGSTIGVRVVGKASGIGYEAELATQEQDGVDASPLYYHLAANKKVADVKLTAGLEVLGSDGGDGAFSTPLGTNHKFLGWSDTYLKGAGDNGIQDLYATAVTKVAGVKLVGQLHKFDSNEGSTDLGTEIGFLAAKKIKNYGLSVKLAQFNAGDDSAGKVDATKVWLTGTAKF